MSHVKITASFTQELAERLDAEARTRALSRSSMLGEAVTEYFRQKDREAFQQGIRAVLEEETAEERAEREAWLGFQRRQAQKLVDHGAW